MVHMHERSNGDLSGWVYLSHVVVQVQLVYESGKLRQWGFS